jgi:uncharacterized protein (TIGR00661 family)
LSQGKKILIAPLDWGLGHTTRCIPLAQTFIQAGCEVCFAGNAVQQELFREFFPHHRYFDLKGYSVHYSKSAWALPFKMLHQVPKILRAIQAERRWLEELNRTEHFDAIISDNRYGLHLDNTPCVIVTHQTEIRVPGSGLLQKMLNFWNRRFLKHFREVWIPDDENRSLSGDLSRHSLIKVQYLGNLSRLDNQLIRMFKLNVLFILSGPEPQRSLLEKEILDLDLNGLKIAMVRGCPAAKTSIVHKDWKIYPHLPSDQLSEHVKNADLIVCRSGYSTIMDLFKLGKRALLIPTPGQTEQVYLADYHVRKHGFKTCRQGNLQEMPASFWQETLPLLEPEFLVKSRLQVVVHEFINHLT